jgi:hypothetical protein
MLEEFAFHHPIDLLNVTLMQGDEDRALIRKVLIDRADADAGNLGYTVRCDGLHALALQNPDYRVEYRFDRLAGSALRGLAASGGLGLRPDPHENDLISNVSNRIHITVSAWH